MRPPSSLDVAVLRVVQEELARYGNAATVRHEWSDGAERWFVEVDPVNPAAARISAGFDGIDDLSVTVGRTWFEMFSFDESSLDEFRWIIRAVLAGYIEEAGGEREGAGTARIFTERGPRRVGAASPWPWRLRSHRRYQPYAARKAHAGPSFVADVEALLFRHDPIGINFGDNPDEYRPEAESITARLPRCESAEDVRALVHKELVRWFDEDTAGPAERYDEIARELWFAWQDTRKAP